MKGDCAAAGAPPGPKKGEVATGTCAGVGSAEVAEAADGEAENTARGRPRRAPQRGPAAPGPRVLRGWAEAERGPAAGGAGEPDGEVARYTPRWRRGAGTVAPTIRAGRKRPARGGRPSSLRRERAEGGSRGQRQHQKTFFQVACGGDAHVPNPKDAGFHAPTAAGTGP